VLIFDVVFGTKTKMAEDRYGSISRMMMMWISRFYSDIGDTRGAEERAGQILLLFLSSAASSLFYFAVRREFSAKNIRWRRGEKTKMLFYLWEGDDVTRLKYFSIHETSIANITMLLSYSLSCLNIRVIAHPVDNENRVAYQVPRPLE
jgi:hypothetical protein